ncbi:MAG: peptide ABC transporter substrate-binding protein [Reyranella sp.]|jgi:peptide/nickel transport system substrate-binding protein|uniref:peptide ABC transporter substrate-binding protein n=1 Tax=Reyranella sp. TaxID=1929291 RepID=UPI0025E9389A|nr:peptide ABC transporter substrate-binding protein [Reyranella sp.]MBR2815963.1 peptide ABC transporter substrate-binding protein [Reyranella sp.]
MDERDLRGLIDRVKAGRLSRRGFVRRLAAVGFTAPMATQLLAFSGVAMADSRPAYKPTKRGGGGLLKVLWWQGPTLLNPHFAVGTKDQDGSRLFYEPLAAWDRAGNLRPKLAANIPSRENGQLAADGRSVVWKIKQGATWHDGRPVTADDAVFTWQYASDPATAAVTSGSYKDVAVEKIDQYTVLVKFQQPTPFWADTFVGWAGNIIPKHLFGDYIGAKSREAPTNLKPVGTGPYKFKDFKPGDLVTGEINSNYHEPNKPYFDAIEMKGGGDAVSAARAVLQTGEYHFAWNLQVEDDVLSKLEKGGRGRVMVTPSGGIEHMQLNNTDPWTEVNGERSSLKTKHPTLSDPAVRQALSLLIDKKSIQDHIYGRIGIATPNFINNPERFRSKTTTFEFNVDKANEILDKAGWKRGADGIRAKDGKKLKFVYQTSINQPRQKTQAIIKQAAQKAGIDMELKSVTASVFFSSDVANPDTYTKFYADLQEYSNGMNAPDPEVFLRQFCSWEAATKDNKWQGRNITRWQNKEYDDIHKAAQVELDPIKRAAMLIKLNELAVNNVVVIPIVARPGSTGMNNQLVAEISGWDNNTWDLASWYREG